MQGYVWYWLTALLWAVEALAGCPKDYRMHGGSCYKAFNDRENFLGASEKCSTDGGTLAMPKDNNTNAFLVSLKNAVDSTSEFWFGLVNQHEEGVWQWIDGTPVGNYRAWSPGESNNQDDEDCAEYSSNTWNGEECSEERRFICQIILAGCPEGYIYHEPSRVCYKAFNSKKNYAGAVAVCSSDGGTLAMPRDNATNNFLIYLKNAVDNRAWFRFGLTELHREGTWMWADNVTLGNFSAWGPGEPNNYDDQDEDCGEYFRGNDNNSKKNKWNDGQCSTRNNRKFICQVLPTDDSSTVPSVGTERPSPSTGRVVERSSSTSTIKPAVTSSIDASTTHSVPSVGTERPSPSTDEEKKTPPWLVGVVCAVVVVIVIIAVVTVLLCRRKNNPGANVPGKGGNEMKNLDTPERHGHAASEGTVDNIIYNTEFEDEGFVDNVIYNAGDDGTVDNIIYQGQDSKSNDQENAPESQYESVN